MLGSSTKVSDDLLNIQIVIKLFYCGLCLLSSFAFCQRPYYTQYTEEKGLLDNKIYSLSFDKKGKLWIGTESGLCYFDGHQFFEPKGQEGGYPAAQVYPAADGKVWFTDFRQKIYYQENDSVVEQKLPDSIPLHIPNFISDQSGTTYAIDGHGCIKINAEGDASHSSKVFANDLVKCEESSKYYLFNGNLYTWRPGENLKISCRYDLYLKPNSPITLLKSEKDIYFTHRLSKHLIQLTTSGELDTVLTYKKPTLVALMHNNELWIGSKEGLHYYKKTGNTWSFAGSRLEGMFISALRKDKKGNLWVGTKGKGLIRFYGEDISFCPIPKGEEISTVNKIGNRIFVGTDKGRFYTLRNDEWSVFDSVKKIQKTYSASRWKGDTILLSTDILELFDSSGNKIKTLGTKANGLVAHHYQNGRHYRMDWNGIGTSSQGLSYGNNCLKNTRTPYFDTYKNSWICSDGKALYRQPLSKDCSIEIILPSRKTLEPTKICSLGDTLAIFDKYSNSLLLLDSSFDLIDSVMLPKELIPRKMLTSRNAIILLGRDRLFELRNGKTYPLEISVGLNFQKAKTMEFANKYLCIALPNGLLRLPTSKIRNKSSANFQFLLSSLKIDNRLANPNENLKLPSGKHSLALVFDLIQFEEARPIELTYSLDSKNWVALPTTTRRLEIAELPFGSYTLQVRLSGESTILWELPINVALPYWQQWWFLVLVFFLGIGLVMVFFAWRIRQLQHQNAIIVRQQELEKKLKISNLNTLRAQLNPHFMFNALNAIQHYIFVGDRLQASHFLGKFASLMRNTLESAQQEMGTLAAEIESLKTYLELECLRLENNLDYHIEVEKGINPEEVILPIALLQPYVENAIKHGLSPKKSNRKLWVRVIDTKGSIIIEIEDNGVGRKSAEKMRKSEQHLSFSTTANQKRLAIMNELYEKDIKVRIEDVVDTSDRPSGTKIYIEL